MKKCTLILPYDINSNVNNENKYKKVISGIKRFLRCFNDRKIHQSVISRANSEVEIIIIGINTSKNNKEFIRKRILQAIEWCIENNVQVVAFDDVFIQNYMELIKETIKETKMQLCMGDNLQLSVILKSIKKVLKSKGIELANTETALLSKSFSEYEYRLIKHLSPSIKYFTYISNNPKISGSIVDEMFEDYGFSIRICSDLKECAKDIGLIINFADDKIDENIIRRNKSIMIFDPINNSYLTKGNITVLNKVIIDTSNIINEAHAISNQNRYRLSEMYLLLSMDRLDLLNGSLTEVELTGLYSNFIKHGFKISTLVGTNL